MPLLQEGAVFCAGKPSDACASQQLGMITRVRTPASCQGAQRTCARRKPEDAYVLSALQYLGCKSEEQLRRERMEGQIVAEAKLRHLKVRAGPRTVLPPA